MDEKKVMGAIRQLREHMRLNQTDFARQVFDKTLPTQQRYETQRAPRDGDTLAMLADLARKERRPDLAEIFKAAALGTMSERMRNLIREPDARPIRKPA